MAGEEEDRPGADATEALGALLGYRAYARRWVFLLVLSLLNFSNAAVQGSGAACGRGRGRRRAERGPGSESSRSSHLPLSQCAQGARSARTGRRDRWECRTGRPQQARKHRAPSPGCTGRKGVSVCPRGGRASFLWPTVF